MLVCDVTDALAQDRDRSGSAIYLATDTHWRPEAAAAVARALATFLGERVKMEKVSDPGYQVEESEVAVDVPYAAKCRRGIEEALVGLVWWCLNPNGVAIVCRDEGRWRRR